MQNSLLLWLTWLLALKLGQKTVKSLISIEVTDVTDEVANIASCYPTAISNQCNFRSAWEACNSYSSSNNPCVIMLPAQSQIEIDVVTYGSFILQSGANIQIEGNEALVVNIAASSSLDVQQQQQQQQSRGDISIQSVLHQVHREHPFTQRFQKASKTVGTDEYDIGTHINELVMKPTASSKGEPELQENTDQICGPAVSNYYTYYGYYYHEIATPNSFIIANLSSTSTSSQPTLSLSSFTIQQFGSSLAYGGAISLLGDVQFTINSMSFVANIACVGGAIRLKNNNAKCLLQNSVFMGNGAYSYGGAIAINDNINVIMTNNNIVNNIAQKSGGAIYLYGSKNIVLNGNYFGSNQANANGGAILLKSLNYYINLNNNSYVRNSAYSGGTIAFYNSNKWINITNSVFNTGSAKDRGGCIYFEYFTSYVLMTFNTFQNCHCNNYGGSIAFEYKNRHITITDTKFYNSYSTNNGGVMRIGSQNIYIQLQRNVYNNSYSSQGAGIYIYDSNQYISIQDSAFTFAPSLLNRGGALRMYSKNVNVTVSNCLMYDLPVLNDGPISIYESNVNVTIRDVWIDKAGSPSAYGGGVYLDQGNRNVILQNVTIRNCQSISGSGMYIYLNHINVYLVSCTFENNIAYQDGGGIYFGTNNTQMMIAGCTFTNNSAASNGATIYQQEANNYLVVIDKEGFDNYRIIQTEHPYQSAQSGTQQNPYIIMTKSINVPNAIGFILLFDPQTNIYFTEVLNIYTDASMTTLLYSSPSKQYPGVNIPPLVVTTSTLYIVFENTGGGYTPTAYSDGRYGFKLYLTPIIENPIQPTIIQNNQAGGLGGGLYAFSQNSNGIVVNTMMIGNKAAAGGGLYLRDSNTQISVFHSSFIQNQATSDEGGAVSLLAAHYGSLFHNISFIGNVATVNGGAIYGNVQNGVGVLNSGNAITFQYCTFMDNIARQNGGSLYVESGNIFNIEDCIFDNNTAMGGSGGGIYGQQTNTLTISSAEFTRNKAGLAGGAIASAVRNTFTITDIDAFWNVAKQGGAIYIASKSTFQFKNNINVTQNEAKIGGAIALSEASIWTFTPSVQHPLISIDQNVAQYGSAFFMYSVQQSSNKMQNLNITNNVAHVGGTLYYLYDNSMTSAPSGYNDSSNHWINNQAPYGTQVGTQATSIVGPSEYNVVVYDQALKPALVYSLHDHYGQFLPLNGSTSFYPSIDTSIPAHCEGSFPFISGSDTIGTGVLANNGYGVFNNLLVSCAPNGSLSLKIQALLGVDLGIPTSKSAAYDLSFNTMLSFRYCTAGEFVKNGQCVTCVNGSYSLSPNSLVCTECLSVNGIDTCFSNQINLDSGYWRRYPTTSAVLSCPYASNCLGGTGTGDNVCVEGSSGPLCGVCLDGYYLDGDLCVPCQGGNLFNPYFVAFIVIVAVLVVVGSIVYFDLYGKCFGAQKAEVHASPDNNIGHKHNEEGLVVPVEEEERELSDWELLYLWLKCKYGQIMVKVKIIVSTLQVVISSAEVLSVQYPPSFTNAMSSISILNFSISQIFPFGCSNSYSFITTLVITTLLPIALTVLLFICFWIEYRVLLMLKLRENANSSASNVGITIPVDSSSSSLRRQKRKEKEETDAVEADRVAIYNASREKYLNYFFYLTYLVLPSVTTTIFQMYNCTDIDPNNESPNEESFYLTADLRISCDSEMYSNGVIYATIMVLVYPIGIPLMYFCLLYQNREELKHRNHPLTLDANSNGNEGETNNTDDNLQVTQNPLNQHKRSMSITSTNSAVTTTTTANSEKKTTTERELSQDAQVLSFLWEAYLPQYWYWEVIETTRRLVLTAVLSICASGTPQQSVFSIMLSLIYIKIYSFYYPYAEESESILAETGQYQIFFTFFCGLIITNQLLDSNYTTLLGLMLVMMNLAVIILSFYFELEEYYNEEDEMLKEEDALKENSRLKSLVLRLRTWIYGRNALAPIKRKPQVEQSSALSKSTSLYLHVRRRRVQESSRKSEALGRLSGAANSNQQQQGKMKQTFSRVDPNVKMKQILQDLQAQRDSDDEDNL